jgi:hypothetical protein
MPDDDTSNAVAGSVNLKRAFSKLHGSVAVLFDSLGIRRNATIPHSAGEEMHEHINAVGKVLTQVGGATRNFATATHTEHDPNGGATILHPSDELRKTVVPKDSPEATKAIQAARSFVNKVASLIGDDDRAVQVAKSQLALIAKNDGAGMTAWDIGAALLSIPSPLIQKLTRMHAVVKHGHQTVTLTGPRVEG